MPNILVVTGSARPQSVNSTVVPVVVENLKKRGDITVEVADLKALSLPFYDGDTAPSQPGFTPQDPAVQAWSEKVSSADGVVFVAPEYNHSLSAIQKNAIDWLYNEWTNKPVALVAYGFYAGRHAIAQFEEINTVIKTHLDQKITGLQFGEDLEVDGTVKDATALDEKLSVTFDELIKTIGGSHE